MAMENVDAISKCWDVASWKIIDGSGEMDDGTVFEGVDGLRNMLLYHSGEFVAAVIVKLLMYAVGRNLQYYDAPAVREIVRASASSQYSFSSLVTGVVKSVPFQMREAH